MSNLSEINAAILVGGLGTRLQPVLKGKPKALVKIRKHPFLEYILQQLDQAGLYILKKESELQSVPKF